MSLYGAKREIERGDEAWERHGERNRERGRIRPSEPQAHRKKNLWPINTGKIFRFGYEILLLIAFSYWVGLDLICFCFGSLKHRIIERDTEIVFVNVTATSVRLPSTVSSLTIEENLWTINTVRPYTHHHQIIGTAASTFFPHF